MTSKIYCFIGRHDWSGSENNVCSVCGKVAVGLPKFVNPPEPPINKYDIKLSDCLSGKLQIPPVRNPIPCPPIRSELEEEVEVGL